MFLPSYSDLALVLLCSIRSFQSAHLREMRWQHTVRFARSEHSHLHIDQKNRRNLWNSFPLTYPCVRPLREKMCQFHDYFRFALEPSFGSSHRHLCCGCKISVVHAKRPYFWSTSSTNQATDSTLLKNQQPHQAVPLVYQENINYKNCSACSKIFFSKKRKRPAISDRAFSR